MSLQINVLHSFMFVMFKVWAFKNAQLILEKKFSVGMVREKVMYFIITMRMKLLWD